MVVAFSMAAAPIRAALVPKKTFIENNNIISEIFPKVINFTLHFADLF